MNTITLEQLKEHEACTRQLLLFKELFGKEVELTVRRCIKYYDKFNWDWAAGYLLSDELYEEYLNIRQLAWEEYKKIQQPAWEEYKKIQQPAWEEYKKKLSQTFGECYLKMEEPK